MTSEKRVFLVDDDEGLTDLIRIRLSARGYRVDSARDGYAALNRLPEFRPHVVVTDLKMNGLDGMRLAEEIQHQYPGLPIIMLTAYGTIPDAVDATNKGVFAFLTKPFDSKRLVQEVARACEVSAVADGDAAEGEESWRSAIVTCSPLMEDLLRRARMVAETEASVFISGPSGVGKELLAQAIHKASRRRQGPMVAVNCAAIPETLLESELFGHAKGAFTGASKEYPGLFQAAEGGTLFLDEVGDIPVSMQAKLLRALQEREIRPVGSVTARAINIRLVSASWQDLGKAIAAGLFRQDLYYRLNVVTLEVPPLSVRREDIPLLANHMLKALSAEGGKRVNGFAPEAMQVLVAAEWPGNVRQLYNLVENTYALTTTPIIPLSLVQQAVNASRDNSLLPLSEAKRAFERDYLVRVMRLASGNVSQAAQIAGRNRTDIYKLLSRHGIQPADFK